MTFEPITTRSTTPALERGRRRRRAWAVLSCAAATAVLVGAAAPAPTAPTTPAKHPVAAHPHAGASSLPELNPQALQQAISSAPSRVTGVLARVSGPAGHWTGTYGVADTTTRQPVPVDGRFRLGSVTKTFIATVMLQLAAEHRVDLDQPVQHYLPDTLPADYPPTPVRTLLNFTSGLPELTADDLPSTPEAIVRHRFDDHPLSELVAKAVRHDRPFTEPGSMQVYGATGYYVAAMLVEKLTGHSYEQEITRRILHPLHLRDTTAPETDPTIPGPHAHGYLAVPRPDGGSELADVTEQNPGAGGMISTTAGLDRFLTALFRGRLLPPAQMKELLTVPDKPYLGGSDNDPGHGRAYYGAGLMRVTLPGHDGRPGVTVWGKTGSTYGYTDGLFTTPDLRRRLTYCFNPVTGGGNDIALVNRIITAAYTP
ncbi:serine hydrolase domain-containing protein [Streptomyces sp. NPDC020192]|uniref:serine hydrolase domain-containing protein n=1 Tax=Streptomyces sp. NPDC020192 TaxID=3365066 RepID=UPI0037BD168C